MSDQPSTDIDYSRQYSRLHERTLQHAAIQARTYQCYLDHLKLPKNSAVLDVGCGYGFFLRAAIDAGFAEVLGIDTSPQQVDAAHSLGLPAILVANSADWLRSQRARFDAIFLFDVLEHIPVESQIEFLRDLRLALKPSGRILVRAPNGNSTFAGRMRWGDWTHRCTFTESSIDFILHHAGFVESEVRNDIFSRYPLWIPRPSALGVIRAIHFGIRQLQLAAEFGWETARRTPLTFNLVATAKNP